MHQPRSLKLSRSFAILAFLAASFSLSLPARAVPVDVFFDGPTTASFPNTNFGISQTQALNAQSAFGVPIVDTFDFIGSAVGALSFTQSLQSFTPNPPTASTNLATSAWTAQNVTGQDLLGASYLFFTSSSPFTKNGVMIDYADANVGLTIDAALGWAILRTSMGSQDFFYPAIVLDRSVPPLQGNFMNGQIVPLDVDYVVNEPLLDAPGGSGDYQLPLLNVGFAFRAVPEPGTAVLVSLGLVGLAIRRRRS